MAAAARTLLDAVVDDDGDAEDDLVDARLRDRRVDVQRRRRVVLGRGRDARRRGSGGQQLIEREQQAALVALDGDELFDGGVGEAAQVPAPIRCLCVSSGEGRVLYRLYFCGNWFTLKISRDESDTQYDNQSYLIIFVLPLQTTRNN